ncbi:hypothetical protein FB451DRAFT_108461 [Mycena latifolia]|nr:hypothetical protein FB451DRAFT_108461 [Mycena latifolia]
MPFKLRTLSGLVVLAVIATPSLGQQPGFTCFGGTVGNCNSYVPQFCNSLGNFSFGPGDINSHCFNVGVSGKRCDLTVVNTGNSVSTPRVVNCINAMYAVNGHCASGGYAQYQGDPFAFESDPNTGVCSPAGGN